MKTTRGRRVRTSELVYQPSQRSYTGTLIVAVADFATQQLAERKFDLHADPAWYPHWPLRVFNERRVDARW